MFHLFGGEFGLDVRELGVPSFFPPPAVGWFGCKFYLFVVLSGELVWP